MKLRTYGVVCVMCIALFGAVPTFADSIDFEPGTSIRLTKSADGSSYECKTGKIITDEFNLLEPNGKSFKVSVKNSRRITATNEKRKITPSFSYTESLYNLHDFERTDGSIFRAAIYAWAGFALDCADGKMQNWALSNFKNIEVSRTPVSSGGKNIRIQLKNGQTLNVPVNKDDIVSIIFE